tara:strand:- start:20057 stop:20569 length:513 start_codon:yes stop_codon:yes gene_type:complete
MATALFISREDLVRNTLISGSLDVDKFIQFIKIAQVIHVQNFTGTKLYDAISNMIINNTLTQADNPNYLKLVNDFIQPLLIQYAMVEYLPFAAYTVGNGGVYKHTSETSVSVDKLEVDYLIEKSRKLAEYYTERFTDYMIYNQNLFPEYTTNNQSDVYPDYTVQNTGWNL